MSSRYPRLLATTLWFVAAVQFVLGVAFLAAPEQAAHALGLAPAPGWANWLFGMMAARFLGFAFGMAFAARNPAGARSWIAAITPRSFNPLFVRQYSVRGGTTG